MEKRQDVLLFLNNLNHVESLKLKDLDYKLLILTNETDVDEVRIAISGADGPHLIVLPWKIARGINFKVNKPIAVYIVKLKEDQSLYLTDAIQMYYRSSRDGSKPIGQYINCQTMPSNTNPWDELDDDHFYYNEQDQTKLLKYVSFIEHAERTFVGSLKLQGKNSQKVGVHDLKDFIDKGDITKLINSFNKRTNNANQISI